MSKICPFISNPDNLFPCTGETCMLFSENTNRCALNWEAAESMEYNVRYQRNILAKIDLQLESFINVFDIMRERNKW